MAKILATEIRVGNLLEFDKRVWRVLKSYHVHVGGRGGAYMQIEIKDIESGQKRNERLSTDEKIERPYIDRRTMTYSYHDGNNWVFMDNETYEQLTLGEDFLEGQTGFLMPNMEVEINFHNGRAIGIQLPTTVVLEVVDTEPGIKNATATTSFKPAKVETGISVQVPPFVNNGEKIRVNTDDGSYVERAGLARSAFRRAALRSATSPVALRFADLVAQALALLGRQARLAIRASVGSRFMALQEALAHRLALLGRHLFPHLAPFFVGDTTQHQLALLGRELLPEVAPLLRREPPPRTLPLLGCAGIAKGLALLGRHLLQHLLALFRRQPELLARLARHAEGHRARGKETRQAGRQAAQPVGELAHDSMVEDATSDNRHFRTSGRRGAVKSVTVCECTPSPAAWAT